MTPVLLGIAPVFGLVCFLLGWLYGRREATGLRNEVHRIHEVERLRKIAERAR